MISSDPPYKDGTTNRFGTAYRSPMVWFGLLNRTVMAPTTTPYSTRTPFESAVPTPNSHHISHRFGRMTV